ncbi:MFS transporter [Anaerobiospirillum thomasii]|uniref:Inner membrane protein ybjJ n=1 Tax=Anaerobiospirillum thomasii TaxID=179995 RepID=A0A2X0V5Q7_9GAMM|nr:MFS transporter [Anaerobiospirillum thomasii]SPT69819.1 Inner membrane protein ybjJ [Anaerobiospirillum thomasii]
MLKEKIYNLSLRALSFFSHWKSDKSSITKDQYLNAKMATILAFFAAGLSTAPWASVVPYVKMRLDLNEMHYASIILCFGLGAVIGMPLTGYIVSKTGVKKVILLSLATLYGSMLLLTLESITLPLAYASALIWGMSLGVLDVANNIHAALLEKLSGKHLMSRFHGFFTLGCIFAAVFFTLLLYASLHTFSVALMLSIFGIILTLALYPRLIDTKGEYTDEKDSSASSSSKFKVSYILVILGIIALIMYLTEGMVYDWSGVYLIEKGSVAIELATLGYLAFEGAITLMRFFGDSLVQKTGELRLLTIGSITGAAALFTIASTHDPYLMLISFFIAGLSLANIVPVMFSLAAKTDAVHQGKAIAFVGTLGYSGLLLGPGILGAIATLTSLSTMFVFVALLCLVMALLSFITLRGSRHAAP